jgi:hypothetical protein
VDGGSGTTLAGLLEKLAQFGSGPRGPGTRVYLRPVGYVGQALLTYLLTTKEFQYFKQVIIQCSCALLRLKG